jgi:hypothetical protein
LDEHTKTAEQPDQNYYMSVERCGDYLAALWQSTERRLVMTNVIEFYIPAKFRKTAHWVPPEQRGKVIDFCLQVQKPA